MQKLSREGGGVLIIGCILFCLQADGPITGGGLGLISMSLRYVQKVIKGGGRGAHNRMHFFVYR